MALFKLVLFVGVLGHTVYGMPLEDPSDNFEPFFPLIVGGVDAKHTPYMASIRIGSIFKSLVCGASIVKQNWVLCAAHCIGAMLNWNGDLIQTSHIGVGSTQWSEGITAEIEEYYMHPEYNAWTIKHDIGGFKLTKKLVFNEHVAPIALHRGEVGGGVSCSVTGWGTLLAGGIIPNFLQQIYVVIMSPKECEIEMKKAISGTGMGAPDIDHKIEICARHIKGAGHGMCHGDSGSALTMKYKKKLEQVGIVSWGVPCGRGAPDIFVRVAAYIDTFLKDVMNR